MDMRKTAAARPAVVLLDIDGTLVRCGQAGRRAMELAFLEMTGRDDVCDFPFGGGTDRGIARRGLENASMGVSEELIDRFLSCYLTYLPDALRDAQGYEVMPQVNETVDAFEATPGIAVGLGTGNCEEGARAKLHHGGLDRFAFGGYGGEFEKRADVLRSGAERGAARLGVDLDRVDVLVIGDTVADVTAAHAIGAVCLAVLTGWSSAADLHEAGADRVVDNLGAWSVQEWCAKRLL